MSWPRSNILVSTRIRHRDPHFGHVFEIEYTISPISSLNEELVRKHGYFNYNLPGHIFVIKSDQNYSDDKWQKKYHGVVVGVGDGYKHVLHSYPGFYTSYRPQVHYDRTTIDPKEYELYKKLIESLAAKTSKLPHRFSVTTPTTTTALKEIFTPVKFPPQTTQKSTTTTVHYYSPVEILSKPKPTQAATTQIQRIDVLPVVTPTEPMQPVTELMESIEQLQPPEKEKDTTVAYVTQPSTTVTKPRMTTQKIETTQKFTTVFVAIPKEEISTVIEKIPYNEERTTVVLPSSTENSSTTTEKITTLREKEPTTILHQYFDTTTLGTSGIISTVNTPPTSTQFVQNTEPLKVTVPTTTHFYFVPESEIPKTSTFTTEGTTILHKTSTNKESFNLPTTIFLSTTTRESTIPIEVTTEKSTRKPTMTTSIFLVDSETKKSTKENFDIDDIFGKPPTSPLPRSETTTKRLLQSDIDKALFGSRESKQLKATKRPIIDTTQIIYGNFYTPTENPTTIQSTTEFKPSTDQSFSTSISFKVNKRKTLRKKIEKTTTTEKTIGDAKKVLDDFALTLVNHARTIEYLHTKPSRQPKYRRRSFVTRRKVQRKSSTKKKE